MFLRQSPGWIDNPEIIVPTGKKAATAASHTLKNPKATKEEKTASASDLAQAKKGGKK
jgi:hypothetical protein